MTHHNNKLTGRTDFPERRENAMRPSRFLGYDHDELGVHFLNCEALSLAEVEFRRAVWLNPFECTFRLHLIASLIRQRKILDACTQLEEVRRIWPDEPESQRELRKIIDKYKSTEKQQLPTNHPE